MVRYFSIKNNSIQQKLLFSYIFLVIFPFAILSFTFMVISEYTLEQEVSNSNLKTLGQIAEKFEMVLDDIISVSNIYYLSPDLSNILIRNSSDESYNYIDERNQVWKMFANYSYAFGWLKYNTSIIGFNGREFYSPNYENMINIDKYKNESWFEEAIRRNGQILWISDTADSLIPGTGGGDCFAATRVLRHFINGEMLGILTISVDESSMQTLYKRAVKDYESIFIIDQDGRVISSLDKTILNTNISEKEYFSKISSNYSGFFIDKLGDIKVLTTFYTVDKTGWKIIAYTPLSNLLESILKLKKVVYIVMFLCIVLAFLMSYYIARRLSIPIKMLYNDISRVETGDLSVRSKVDSGDEIGELARKFNNMVEKIQMLMNNLIYEQRLKRRAELQSLQAQINPHFLYNTLASIRYLLGTANIEVVDTVIVALVKLLKKTLSKGSEIIPIYEEIENLKNYVLIQKVRHEDMLEVKYCVDEKIMNYRILKLILQPLVENAIFHGIEPKGSKGNILIKGYLSEGDIIFEVIDDGVGIPDAVTQELFSVDVTKRHKFELFNGIGLKNIHERIVLNFSENYGLKIFSEAGAGTRIEVRIPAFYKEDEVKRADGNSDSR